jgi:hypothetical protein
VTARRRERVLPELRDFNRSVHGHTEGRVPDHAMRERAALRVLEPALENPQQRDLLAALRTHRKVALHKTRGAGATDALGRYTLFESIRRDRHVAITVVTSLKTYTRNFLERPGGENAITLLDAAGLLEWCKIERTAGAITRIHFRPWGSEWLVFDADTARGIAKKRGGAAHLWVVEEAQDVDLLDDVMGKLITPRKADFDAVVVLNGTPTSDHDTLFAQAAMGVDPDYHVVPLCSWRNPFYGPTPLDRWKRIVEKTMADSRGLYNLDARDYERLLTLAEDSLDTAMLDAALPEDLAWIDDLDPDLLREIFGRWVGDAGKLVYNWHKAARHYWREGPLADLADLDGSIAAAVDALRSAHGQLDWKAVGSYDYGCFPDPAAWVISAWAPGHSAAYELWSNKVHHMDDDDQLDVLVRLLEACRRVGVLPSAAVADLDLHSATTTDRWDRSLRYRLKINLRRAQKPHRLEQIRALNLCLGLGSYRVIKGSDLDMEGRHLRWHRRKRGVEDKQRPIRLPSGRTEALGDHCLDCTRYSLPFLPSQRVPTAEEIAAQRAPHRDKQRLQRNARAQAARRR